MPYPGCVVYSPLTKKIFTHVKKILKSQKKFPPAAGKKSPNVPPAASRKDQKFSACGQKRPKIFRLRRTEKTKNFPPVAGRQGPKFSACGGHKSPQNFPPAAGRKILKKIHMLRKKDKAFFPEIHR